MSKSNRLKTLSLLVLLVSTSVVLASCSQEASPTVGVASSTPLPLPSPSATTGSATPAITATVTATATQRVAEAPQPATLYVREGVGNARDRLVILNALTGKVERQLPLGVPNVDWKILYTLNWPDKLNTTVTALNIESGQVIRTQNLPGQWDLPRIDANTRLGGLTLDGKTLVLVHKMNDQNPVVGTGNPMTQFMIVDSGLQKPTKSIQLNGAFAYDALSADGKRLFLIEHLTPYNTGHYQVRLYDLAASKLIEQPVIDKGEQSAIMQGYAGAQISSHNGDWVFTIYRNREHGPFVHALNTALVVAVCLDLPQTGKDDENAARMWNVVMATDGSRLFAVNSVLGILSEFQTEWPQLTRNTNFKTGQNAPIDPAFAAQHPTGLGSRSVALSNDDLMLFTPLSRGLVAIELNTPSKNRILNSDRHFDSLALSPNGKQLYTSSIEENKVMIFDRVSGRLQAELIGPASPWSLLHIEPRT